MQLPLPVDEMFPNSQLLIETEIFPFISKIFLLFENEIFEKLTLSVVIF
jgi:hypothetical protein